MSMAIGRQTGGCGRLVRRRRFPPFRCRNAAKLQTSKLKVQRSRNYPGSAGVSPASSGHGVQALACEGLSVRERTEASTPCHELYLELEERRPSKVSAFAKAADRKD